MKKSLLFVIGLCVIGFTFFSCKDRKTTETYKISYDSIVVAKEIPLLHENDTTLPFADVDINFTYPTEFRNAEDLERLQQIFLGTFFGERIFDSMTPQQAVDNYLTNYTENYQSLSNDYYADKTRLEGEVPNWYWYSMSNANKILFQNDSLLAYAVEFSDYTGGAHGSYRVTYTNIDLNDLVTLSEEDLFKPDYYKPLTDKIVNSLMKRHNAPVPDSLLMHGFFTVEDIVPNNNFWLDDQAIHYAYNQYEIAPYAAGVIEVSIPYTELEDILLPDGIISRFFLKEK